MGKGKGNEMKWKQMGVDYNEREGYNGDEKRETEGELKDEDR
jgi:hypothetical protein